MDTKPFTFGTPEFRNRARNSTSSTSVKLLTDCHDALVGISPHTTQPSTTNHHLCRRSERPFFLVRSLSRVYPADNARVTLGELFRR